MTKRESMAAPQREAYIGKARRRVAVVIQLDVVAAAGVRVEEDFADLQSALRHYAVAGRQQGGQKY